MSKLLLVASLAVAASAQLPDFYRQVDRVVFVTTDADKSIEAWKPSGVVEVFGMQEVDTRGEYRGKPAEMSFRYGVGRFGDVLANWIQPVGGTNAFTDFLKRHGPGVFGLMHRAPTEAALDAEVRRMTALGVQILQRGPMGDDGSRYVIFDTEPEGKYPLTVYWTPDQASAAPETTKKVTQFAFIIRNEVPVSKYWAKLGWPEMSITHPDLHHLEYHGKPADYKSRLGWMRHGKVVYEWIMPEKGPSTWQDHLDKHGEGMHHMAFSVDDMDKALAEWDKAGYRNLMSGAWGEPGKKGYGRFAYVDTQAAGGIDIEFLWNYK